MPKSGRAGKRNTNRDETVLGAELPVNGQSDARTNTTNAIKPIYRTRAMSPRTRVISLVVGDTICFLIFASLGRGQHGESLNILQIIEVALPFIAGWFIVAPFVGAFKGDIADKPSKMIMRTGLSWLLAWPVAMALRGIFVDHGIPPLTFALIVLTFNLGALILWRWPFALNNNLRSRGL